MSQHSPLEDLARLAIDGDQADEARRAATVHRTSQPRASDVDFARRIAGLFNETQE